MYEMGDTYFDIFWVGEWEILGIESMVESI